MQTLPVYRALGVVWDTDDDCFELHISTPDNSLTRHGLLSAISAIYDPTGFLAPFTVTAKKSMQDVTRKKIAWAEVFHPDLLGRWISWKKLHEISKLKIRRCYKSYRAKVSRYEIHYFSNASEIACRVASYLLLEMNNDEVHIGQIEMDTIKGNDYSLIRTGCRCFWQRKRTICSLENSM